MVENKHVNHREGYLTILKEKRPPCLTNPRQEHLSWIVKESKYYFVNTTWVFPGNLQRPIYKNKPEYRINRPHFIRKRNTG